GEMRCALVCPECSVQSCFERRAERESQRWCGSRGSRGPLRWIQDPVAFVGVQLHLEVQHTLQSAAEWLAVPAARHRVGPNAGAQRQPAGRTTTQSWRRGMAL